MQTLPCRFILAAVSLAILAGLSLGASAQTIRLDDFATLELPGPAARGARTEFVVEGFGQRWQIALDDNHRLFGKLSPGIEAKAAAGGNRFLTGSIADNENSWVRLNWIENRWRGGFFDGDELYLIDRAGDIELPDQARVAPGETLLFRLGDLEVSGVIGHDPLEWESGIEATDSRRMSSEPLS
ncbi:MAG: hypothetical protein ACOCSR_02265, partial [Wenzhouxiangella sp.]